MTKNSKEANENILIGLPYPNYVTNAVNVRTFDDDIPCVTLSSLCSHQKDYDSNVSFDPQKWYPSISIQLFLYKLLINDCKLDLFSFRIFK